MYAVMTQSSLSVNCPIDASDLKLFQQETAANKLSKELPQDFFQQLKFSPDGLRLLASTDGGCLKSWELDLAEVSSSKYYCSADLIRDEDPRSKRKDADRNIASQSTTVQCGESIYDYQWYPFMNSHEPASCCFITSCRDHPIHLWDSAIGKIRCSYSCYNAMDELEAANSVTFNLTGDKIYAGSNRMIRSFDVNYPGELRKHLDSAVVLTQILVK